MKQNIVLEHRQALDAMERATSARASCKRRGTCNGKEGCLKCPAYIEKTRCQAILDEKTDALKKINDQIVAQNDVTSIQQREERQRIRAEKEAQKQARLKAQKPRMAEAQIKKIIEKEGLQETMTTKKKSAPVSTTLSRHDLTVERYRTHKTEKISDSKIAEMYNMPQSTFDNWKRDKGLTASKSANATNTQKETTPSVRAEDVAQKDNTILLQEKFNKLESAYAEIVEQQRQSQAENKELQIRFNRVSNELTVANEMNQQRQELIVALEEALQPLQSNKEIPLESDDVDYKQLYEDSQEQRMKLIEERDHYESLAKERIDRIGQFEAKINEIIRNNNKQIEKFREYERLYLERLLYELTM